MANLTVTTDVKHTRMSGVAYAVASLDDEFTTTKAHQQAGIHVRQLWHWLGTQVITPSVFQAQGTGSNHIWSGEDVAVLALLGELSRLGAKTDVLAEAVPPLRGIVRERSVRRVYDLVVIGRDPFLVRGSRVAKLVTVLSEMPGDGYWVLDMRNLI